MHFACGQRSRDNTDRPKLSGSKLKTMADINSVASGAMSDGGGSGTPLEDEFIEEAASLERTTPTIDEAPEPVVDSKVLRGDSATPTQDEAEIVHDADHIDQEAAPRLTAELISSLAPGVSASGAEAMAAVMEGKLCASYRKEACVLTRNVLSGIPIPSELNPIHDEEKGIVADDVSDDEFAEENLGDLAVHPVTSQPSNDNKEREEASSRLSNVSR